MTLYRLQEEILPELRRERAKIVDDSPPGGCQALVKLLCPNVGVEDGLEVCEALTSASGARQSTAGAGDAEDHVGGVLIVRVQREKCFVLYLGGTRQIRRRHRGDGGVGGNLVTSVARKFSVAGQARVRGDSNLFRSVATC